MRNHFGDQEEPHYHFVPSLRQWLVWELDARIRRLIMEFDFRFFVIIVGALSGEVVRDERREPVAAFYTTWGQEWIRVWDHVYRTSGRRIPRIVLKTVALDKTNVATMRWSRLLSRSDARRCTADSPYLLPVELGAFA